ncbi:unnamed protein product [Allacma fusca]|uniref:DUF4806 domain-containing protein n=1 Tax=Allacma fusca TaxID=39272 RepID=A0A8J2PCZ5_9HEXA|nr:unnamed protein product [Allacma fusca]
MLLKVKDNLTIKTGIIINLVLIDSIFSDSYDSAVQEIGDESPSEVAKKFTFAPVESQFPLHDKVLSRPTLAPPTPVASTSSKFISTNLDRNQKPVSISPRANVTSGNETSVRNDPQPIVNIQPILAEIREHLSAALENINSKITIMDVPKNKHFQPQKFGFPYTTSAELLEFEEKIKTDPDYRELARAALSRVGGQDVSEVTNNIFLKLETFNLILDAVRSVKSTSEATETLMKKAIMTWLQHSVDRIKARQKSAAKKLGH